MCVAATGIVKELDGDIATVDFSGNLVKARAGLVNVKIGDNVLVHAGCILQVLKQSEADELRELYAEMENEL